MVLSILSALGESLISLWIFVVGCILPFMNCFVWEFVGGEDMNILEERKKEREEKGK